MCVWSRLLSTSLHHRALIWSPGVSTPERSDPVWSGACLKRVRVPVHTAGGHTGALPGLVIVWQKPQVSSAGCLCLWVCEVLGDTHLSVLI